MSVKSLIIDPATGTQATVKEALTPPTLEDHPLVVIISPNQQALPITGAAGVNAITGISFGRVLYGNSAGAVTFVAATTYTEQSANFTGSVKSASVNDTSTGTGARSIIITYFDQNGLGPFTESVSLNGTTAINLINSNHCFIEKMEVTSSGSLGWNAAAISLFTGANGTGTTVGSIGFATNASGLGDNTTLWAQHYVPSNTISSLYSFNAGTTGNQIAVTYLAVDNPLLINFPEKQMSDFLTIPSGGILSTRTISNPIQIKGFARIKVYVISNGANTNFFASFDHSEV
jgi:hypothetical protein